MHPPDRGCEDVDVDSPVPHFTVSEMCSQQEYSGCVFSVCRLTLACQRLVMNILKTVIACSFMHVKGASEKQVDGA